MPSENLLQPADEDRKNEKKKELKGEEDRKVRWRVRRLEEIEVEWKRERAVFVLNALNDETNIR